MVERGRAVLLDWVALPYQRRPATNDDRHGRDQRSESSGWIGLGRGLLWLLLL